MLSTVKLLQVEGFCKLDIVVLVQETDRREVIRAVNIPVPKIQHLVELLTEASQSKALELQRLADNMLYQLVAIVESSWSGSKGRLRPSILLLSALLSLALVSYTGSHCSDLGQRIWDAQLNSINFENIITPYRGGFCFKQRRLACLEGFIGGPVWVFGSSKTMQPARLSITAEQFSNLWGPLYAVPSRDNPAELIALHTEGGVLYRSSDSDWLSQSTDWTPRPHLDEILLHWISISPIRRAPGGRAIVTSSKPGDTIPKRLTHFPAVSRLLIGQPTTLGSGSATVTSNNPPAPTYHMNLEPTPTNGLSHNVHCSLQLDEFGKMHTFCLHTMGTRHAYYLPDEYQICFSGGQYVNIGLQKVWKRRPAINYKTMLLEYCSKPKASPERIKKILELRVGLEMSACTRNAQRISLKAALKLAFPDESQAVEAACDTGDAQRVSMFLSNLEGTGVSHEGHLLLYWPLSAGIGEVLELPAQPEWLALLKDTPESACFAVVSGRCLPFIGQDKRRLLRRLCSNAPGSSADAILRTKIELNPQGSVQPPLKVDDKIKLNLGQVQIRNEERMSGQLGFYEPHGAFRRWSNRGEAVHRELLRVDHASPLQISVCIHDKPK